MTPEREKEIRARIEAEVSIGWEGVRELLAELDWVRAKLEVAEAVLKRLENPNGP